MTTSTNPRASIGLASRCTAACCRHDRTSTAPSTCIPMSAWRSPDCGTACALSQPAVRFYNRVGYHDYEGITEDFGERARINTALGKNRALIMRNHGLLTVGRTAREAFVLMKSLLGAADIQLKMEATGGDLIEIPAEICEKTAHQYEHHDSGRGSADWPADLRMLH